ncbi:hypothetical protein IWX47DRAFT_842700 [Phyllosticta citricarpa]
MITNTNTTTNINRTNQTNTGPPHPHPQLSRSSGIPRRRAGAAGQRRPMPPSPSPSSSSSSSSSSQPRREYRSEQNQDLRACSDLNSNTNTNGHNGHGNGREVPRPAPPPPPPPPPPPASLSVGHGVGGGGVRGSGGGGRGGVGLELGEEGLNVHAAPVRRTPRIIHHHDAYADAQHTTPTQLQLQRQRSLAARVEHATPPTLLDIGMMSGAAVERDGDVDEVSLLTGGRIPRSFSTTAQTRVAAVHQRRGVEASRVKGPGVGVARKAGPPLNSSALTSIAETPQAVAVAAKGGGGGRGRGRGKGEAAAMAEERRDGRPHHVGNGIGNGNGRLGTEDASGSNPQTPPPPPPRLPFPPFSGTGHLPLQNGDAAAMAARKNELLAELYWLETANSSSSSPSSTGYQHQAFGSGSSVGRGGRSSVERERAIIAELMDLVHEYPAVVEEGDKFAHPAAEVGVEGEGQGRYDRVERDRERERGETGGASVGVAVVELPASDTHASHAYTYALPPPPHQPAYSRRPVWRQQQQQQQQQAHPQQPHHQRQYQQPPLAAPPPTPSPELYASEPWAVKPRRPGVPIIGLANALQARRRQDAASCASGGGKLAAVGMRGQSSRSFPANYSEFQVETLFRESMLEAARRRQQEEEDEMVMREGGVAPHKPAASSSSSSSSSSYHQPYWSTIGYVPPSAKVHASASAAAVASGSSSSINTSNTTATLPSIYMIRPTNRSPPERVIDPRYNANLDSTRLTPPGAKKGQKQKQRRRLTGGLRPLGHDDDDDAPEVVTAEMLGGAPEIAVAQERSARAPEVVGLETDEMALAAAAAPVKRQGSGAGKQGLSARNSLKKTWRSIWNLR